MSTSHRGSKATGPASSMLCGRVPEAARLAAAAHGARSGKPQRVMLSGEGGSGKTHLLRHVLAECGLMTAWGDGSEFGNAEFGPIKDMLRRLQRERPRDVARLRTRHPEANCLLDGDGDADSSARSRDALFNGLAHGLLGLADGQPLAMVFDDLHLADHATVELLARVGERLSSESLVLVLAYRSDDLPRQHPLRRLRQQWRRSEGLQEIELPPLDDEQVLALAAHRLGDRLGPQLAAELLRLCGGLPLYVEELAQGLAVQGSLRRTAAGLDRARDGTWPLPESLRDSVLLRMAALPASAQRLTERAAVMGSRVDLLTLEAMASDPVDVERLIEAGWLVDTEPGQARFRHALLREVIYGQIPWTRRRHWHAECASRLAATHGPVELVAEHWLAARHNDQARLALLQVTERAWRLHAYADAVVQAVRALELWPDGVEECERLRTLDRLAECALLAGQHDGAARAWVELCERAQRAQLLSHVPPARRRLSLLYAVTGDLDRSVHEREGAADAYLTVALPQEAVRDLYAAAEASTRRQRLSHALELLDRLEDVAGGKVNLNLEVMARSLRGCILARMGRTGEGIILTRGALQMAQSHELVALLGPAYRRLADCHEMAGDYTEARNIFLAGADWCAANGQADGLEACRACALPVLEQAGEWDLTIRLAEEILGDECATQWSRAIAHCHHGRALAFRGEHEAAQVMLQEGLAESQHVGLAALEWSTRAVAAANYWWRGHAQAAREAAHSTLRTWSEAEEHHHIVPGTALLGDVFGGCADLDGLHACVQALSAAARANPQPETLAGLALAQGDVHCAEGRAAEALREWTAAARWLAGMPLPLAKARVQRRLAEAQAALGDTSAAATLLRAAIDDFEVLQAVPYIREGVERLRVLAPDTLTAADRRRLQSGLTARQLQILARVAHGMTDKQIARELELSPRTVEMHVGRLLATLQCRTRAEAVRRGSELGLIGVV